MTVFVTGATGFLGRHLVRALRDDGVVVRTLGRPWTFTSICEQFYQDKPDVVIHLAAVYRQQHDPPDITPMVVANVALPTFLCEAMRTRGITRLVTAGTAFQDYNGRVGVPANLYAATKTAADAMVAYYVDAHGFRVVNLRLLNLYGAHDDRPTLLNTIHDGMDMTTGEQETAFVPVADAVAQIRDAIARTDEMAPGHEVYAGWTYSQPLKDILTTLYPTLTLHWAAKPYRLREMMQLPTHLASTVPVCEAVS